MFFLTHIPIHIHILPEISSLSAWKSIALCGCGELLLIANERKIHKQTLISNHRCSFVFKIFSSLTLYKKWYNNVDKSAGICHIESVFSFGLKKVF